MSKAPLKKSLSRPFSAKRFGMKEKTLSAVQIGSMKEHMSNSSQENKVIPVANVHESHVVPNLNEIAGLIDNIIEQKLTKYGVDKLAPKQMAAQVRTQIKQILTQEKILPKPNANDQQMYKTNDSQKYDSRILLSEK